MSVLYKQCMFADLLKDILEWKYHLFNFQREKNTFTLDSKLLTHQVTLINLSIGIAATQEFMIVVNSVYRVQQPYNLT